MIFHIDFFVISGSSYQVTQYLQRWISAQYGQFGDGRGINASSEKRMAKFYKLKRRRNRQKAQFEMQP